MASGLEDRSKYICQHCEVIKLNEAQLRNHINRNKHCYAKYQELARIMSQENNFPGDVDNVPTEDPNDEEENLLFPNLDFNELTSTKKFDTGLQLLFKMFDFHNGAGLSESDMDDLLSLIFDPQFNPADIPYRSGRAAKAMMDKLLKSRGYLQVRHYFR